MRKFVIIHEHSCSKKSLRSTRASINHPRSHRPHSLHVHRGSPAHSHPHSQDHPSDGARNPHRSSHPRNHPHTPAPTNQTSAIIAPIPRRNRGIYCFMVQKKSGNVCYEQELLLVYCKELLLVYFAAKIVNNYLIKHFSNENRLYSGKILKKLQVLIPRV